MIFFSTVAYAEEVENGQTAYENYSDYYAASGAENIENSVPKEAQEVLDQLEISPENPQSLFSIDFGKVLSFFKTSFTESLTAPLKVTLTIIGVILIISYGSGLGTFGQFGQDSTAFMGVGITVILLSGLFSLTANGAETVQTITDFVQIAVPVLAVLLTTFGRAVTADFSSVLLLGAAQFLSFFVSYAFVPLVGGCMCLGICASLSPLEIFSNFCRVFKQWTVRILTALLLVFEGILSFQTSVSANAESVGIRSARALLGGSLPVFGNAVSSALGVAGSCLSAIGSTVGVYIIICITVVMLPCMFKILCWRMCLWFAGGFAELCEQKPLQTLFKNLDYGLSILLGALLFVLLLFVISVGIILKNCTK